MDWQPSTSVFFWCEIDGCTFQIFEPPSRPWHIFMWWDTGSSVATAKTPEDIDKRCAEMLAEKRYRDEQAFAALI